MKHAAPGGGVESPDMPVSSEGKGAPRHRLAPPPAEPLLPRSSDESDVGWGGRPDEDDDERMRREVPPHW